MHTLYATKRIGNHENFERGLSIKDLENRVLYGCAIKMITRLEDGVRVRVGTIVNIEGNVVWEGEVHQGVTPFRAFMVSCGLCDGEGGTGTDPEKPWDLPEWVKQCRMPAGVEAIAFGN